MLYGLLFIVVCLASYGLARIAPRLKLLALPGAHRKHKEATPMVGGIAIYVGFLVGWILFEVPSTELLICLSLICFVGVLDDRYSLPSWLRFLAQGIVTYLMIKLTGVQLNSLGILFTSEELRLGAWSIAMTIFATIGVINAVNMSDGLDGLAGSLVLLVLIALLCINRIDVSLILVSVFSVMGFLFWNLNVGRSRASIFMGDAGSTMLGFLLAYLLIKSSQMPASIQPVTALWLLALPLVDAVAVLLVRPLRGKSPFKADRMHYHHQLLDKKLAVNQVLVVALFIQVLLIGLGLFLLNGNVSENGQLIAFLLLFFIYVVRLFKFSAK